jgi:hypothetical protein
MALPVTGARRTFVPQEICRPHGRQWKRNRLKARSACCARRSAPKPPSRSAQACA